MGEGWARVNQSLPSGVLERVDEVYSWLMERQVGDPHVRIESDLSQLRCSMGHGRVVGRLKVRRKCWDRRSSPYC